MGTGKKGVQSRVYLWSSTFSIFNWNRNNSVYEPEEKERLRRDRDPWFLL